MSKINKNDLSKALDELKSLASKDVVSKGHNSRGTVTTEVPGVAGVSGATQVYHTPANSNPRGWAGSTEQDVPEDGNTDSISENGTDYEAQAKMMKSIAVKLAKGLPLTKFEKSVLKAMDEEDDKKDKKKDEVAKGKNPFEKKDEEEDEKEDKKVEKSLMDFANEDEEVSKGFDVSNFLASFAGVVAKSQNASESRIKSDILSALAEADAGNAEFQKSLAEAVVNVGEAIQAITQRLDQIESGPARGAKSVTGAQVINKGGFDGGETPLTKSQVSDALADMVMKGQLQAHDVFNFEANGGQISPELEAKVRRHINGR